MNNAMSPRPVRQLSAADSMNNAVSPSPVRQLSAAEILTSGHRARSFGERMQVRESLLAQHWTRKFKIPEAEQAFHARRQALGKGVGLDAGGNLVYAKGDAAA